MKNSIWRTRSAASSSAALLLLSHISSVAAVALTGCSTQNTGTSMTSDIFMSNGKCHDTCNGYAYAITQYEDCWCSNVAPGSTTSIASCNVACPGYPYEYCGNQQKGLYGYIALGRNPSSTEGASSSSSQAQSTTPFLGGGGGGGSTLQASSNPPPTSAPTTTVVSQAPPSTVVSQAPASTVSVTPTQASTSSTPSSSSSSSSSSSTESTTTTTPSPSVVTSASVVTVSGAVVTHFLTTTPTATGSALPESTLARPTRAGLSNGAVAGITVGAIAGAAAIGLLLFLFCWRKRRQARDAEGSGGVKRTGSVMSKMGLLRTGSATSAPMTRDGPSLPRLETNGIPFAYGPESASTQMSENKRHSRPMFVDSRLNPNALMTHNDHSRTSIATLQDNQDYSRPLEVRNPD